MKKDVILEEIINIDSEMILEIIQPYIDEFKQDFIRIIMESFHDATFRAEQFSSVSNEYDFVKSTLRDWLSINLHIIDRSK